MDILPSKTKGSKSQVNNHLRIISEWDLQHGRKWCGEYGEAGRCTLTWFSKYWVPLVRQAPGIRREACPRKGGSTALGKPRKVEEEWINFIWTWRFTRWSVELEETEGEGAPTCGNVRPAVCVSLEADRPAAAEDTAAGLGGRRDKCDGVTSQNEPNHCPQVSRAQLTMARTHFRGTSLKRRTLPSLWARTSPYSLCYDECMFRTSHTVYIFLRASSILLKKSETENWKKRKKN